MNKIDIGNWSEFPLGGDNGLFDVILPTGDIQAQKTDDGDYPLISSGKNNNGICKYIEETFKSEKIQANTITVDMFGKAFYHDYEYYCVSHGRVNILIPKFNITKNIGLYIAKVIENVTIPKYEFLDMCSQGALIKKTIKLPVDSNGKPDWEYMENYMKKIMQDSEEKIRNLQNINDLKRNIQTENWGDFDCSELFTAKNTGNILARDVEDGSGNTPYVTASGINNGVSAYIDASKYDIIKGHCILIGGKTFTVTYQADDFVSNDSHNFVIRTNGYNISDLSYKYLVTVIRSYFGQKYPWNDAVTKDKFLGENIPLPVDSNGKPDWEYMENYMKKILEDTESKLDKLTCC